jgi:hypothetical protein
MTLALQSTARATTTTTQNNDKTEDTRGQIERALDKAIESLDVEDSVSWIWEEQETSEQEDLALGYVLGYLACTAHNIIFQKKVWKKARS